VSHSSHRHLPDPVEELVVGGTAGNVEAEDQRLHQASDELLDRIREVSVGAVAHQFHAYQDARLRVPFPSRIHFESFGAPHFPGLNSEPFPFPREQEALEWAANPGELDLSAPELIVEVQRDGSMSCAVVYNHYGYSPAVAAELADAFQQYVRMAVERPYERLAELWPEPPLR
jgi:hypothetical protein